MEAASKQDRREVLLDAAIEVVAKLGMRGLTHRAVEAEAQLPHGSTTYYFGTRRELLVALMSHMAERGRRALEPIARQLTLRLADRSQPLELEAISAAMLAWVDHESSMELARYELQVTAARDPEMKALMTSACNAFVELTEPLVIACGSKNPGRDAKIVQAALDGLILNRLTNAGAADETLTHGIRVILGSIAND